MSDEERYEKKIASWLGDESVGGGKDELMADLDALYANGPDRQRTLRAMRRLQENIPKSCSKQIYYGGMENSPIGSILIAVGDQGVIAIDIGITENEFEVRIREKYQAIVIHSPQKVAGVVEQLQEYFEGKRSSFKLKLYLDDLTRFQKQVLLTTLDIPLGQITTYGEVARRLGKVQLARAVGQALARNPIPIVIPCHRVLAADGSLHGYSGGKGVKTKAQLLQLEGAL